MGGRDRSPLPRDAAGPFAWSDGGVERAFSRDDLLTNLTVYWATGTIGSSMRLHLESRLDPGPRGTVSAPVAVTALPADLFGTPREWVERQLPVARWTELPRGGHFAEWEFPDLIAADLRAFFAG